MRGLRTYQLLGVAVLLGVVACRQGIPPINTAARPTDATISGTVRGPERIGPLEGRVVEAISIDNGARHRATTSSDGEYRLTLSPGKYRIELAVRDGETIVRQPEIINLDRRDVDAGADFVLSTPRLARPRYFAPRGNDGLGSAIG